MTLAIVEPITVTDAMLSATDVPEADYAAWSSVTTYAIGDRVIVTAQHKVYESVAASNLNNPPATSPTKWLEVSATNRWKLFDRQNVSQTVQALAMSYTLEPGRVINAVAALNVTAGTVRCRLVDAIDGTVYDQTITLTGTIPESTWHSYFFADVYAQTEAIFDDLPAYGSADLIVDFAAATGNVACGALLFGYLLSFGLGVQAGASVGIQDYSRKETDDFGFLELVERGFAKRAEFTMLVPAAEIEPLYKLLARVRARPCLWIGKATEAATILYGWFKDFDIVVSYPDHAECSLEIEGLI